MTISNAYVTDDRGCRLNGTVTMCEETEQAYITFDGVVGRGKWQLHLAFEGFINGKLRGFYRSTYKSADGKEHVLASTQFEPNDARRAFPCFDEPSFKATFALTLVVDPHLTALSNTKVRREHIIDECPQHTVSYPNGLTYTPPAQPKRVIQFDKTMKMSTYLVAYVVGELECTEPVQVDGTEVRVWCIPGKKHLATFSLKVAQFSLSWYEKYFGVKHPSTKLDMVAIPDFALGAMENLGCIIYRETALLVDEEHATITELVRVADVVTHEIAHQWFGNLVTMKWWNGLWLNEAFATFMNVKVVAEFCAQWNRWQSFSIERANAFNTDGLASTRPIEAPVLNPADALGFIDVITYRKGCSVLRQLEQFIGEKAFNQGIAKYIRSHLYGNAETTDLWDAIGSVTDLPAREMMESWVFQPGHPLVTVSEADVNGSITLSQRPFKYLAEAVDETQTWLVPVHLRVKNGANVSNQWVLLDQPEKTIYLGEGVEWVVVNANGYGFYRTNYSPTLAAKITANVSLLGDVERFNLVNDAWACLQAGLQTSEEYLTMVKRFAGETDPNVWSVIGSSLKRLHDMLPNANQPGFQRLVQDLARPTLTRLGWQVKEGESTQDRQVRGAAISLLGTAGNDEAVHSQAKELFTAYRADKRAMATDIVPAVVSLVAYTGGQAEYDNFKAMLSATNVPQEAVRYLMALAGFKDSGLLEKTLKATTDGTARTQDAPSLIIRLMSNSVIQKRTWEFVKKNWDWFVGNISEYGLITMLDGIVALDTPELEADVHAFFSTHRVKGGDKALAQALEELRINVLFAQRETEALEKLFCESAS